MPIPQPNLRGLVDNQVGDVITRLVTAVNALESGIARFSTPVTPAAPAAPAPFTLTPQILRTIRDALQVGGATPLNVTKLLGIESFIDEDLIVTGDWTFQGTVEFDNTVTLSGFTATRILFVGAAGVISESANLTFDTSTGTVTIRGNNTGITTPFPLNVLRFLDTDTTTALNQPTGKIEFYSSDATVGPGVQSYIASISASQQGPGILVFGTGSIGSVTERFRIDNLGNLGLGVTAWGTNAVRVYGIAAGTAPTTRPADMIQMWVADAAAGDARLYILTESGTTAIVIGNGIISSGAGAAATPAYTFGSAATTGLYDTGSGMGVAVAGVLNTTFGTALVSIAGRVLANQSSTTGAVPVASLVQADISEEFIRFQGSAAAAVLTQSIVAAADVATFTPAGYLKCFVIDDGNQITDQAYYVQIGTLA